MSIPKYSDIIMISNSEISEAIIQAEKELFNLKFKKATRQSFKPHEIRHTKRRLAHLKTLLSLRLDIIEKSHTNVINKLIKNQNYITENF